MSGPPRQDRHDAMYCLWLVVAVCRLRGRVLACLVLQRLGLGKPPAGQLRAPVGHGRIPAPQVEERSGPAAAVLGRHRASDPGRVAPDRLNWNRARGLSEASNRSPGQTSKN